MSLSTTIQGILNSEPLDERHHHAMFRRQLEGLNPHDIEYIENMMRVNMPRHDAIMAIAVDMFPDDAKFAKGIYDVLAARRIADGYRKAVALQKPDYKYGDLVEFSCYTHKYVISVPGGTYTTHHMLPYNPKLGEKKDTKPKRGLFIGTRTLHCGFTPRSAGAGYSRRGDFEHESSMRVGVVCLNSITDPVKISLFNIKKL